MILGLWGGLDLCGIDERQEFRGADAGKGKQLAVVAGTAALEDGFLFGRSARVVVIVPVLAACGTAVIRGGSCEVSCLRYGAAIALFSNGSPGLVTGAAIPGRGNCEAVLLLPFAGTAAGLVGPAGRRTAAGVTVTGALTGYGMGYRL